MLIDDLPQDALLRLPPAVLDKTHAMAQSKTKTTATLPRLVSLSGAHHDAPTFDFVYRMSSCDTSRQSVMDTGGRVNDYAGDIESVAAQTVGLGASGIFSRRLASAGTVARGATAGLRRRCRASSTMERFKN
jgi:hypothetical protein